MRCAYSYLAIWNSSTFPGNKGELKCFILIMDAEVCFEELLPYLGIYLPHLVSWIIPFELASFPCQNVHNSISSVAERFLKDFFTHTLVF